MGVTAILPGSFFLQRPVVCCVRPVEIGGGLQDQGISRRGKPGGSGGEESPGMVPSSLGDGVVVSTAMVASFIPTGVW